jgi:hypothetical protein
MTINGLPSPYEIVYGICNHASGRCGNLFAEPMPTGFEPDVAVNMWKWPYLQTRF